VNDYRKYGLLRALTEVSQLRLGVCWLRTVNDGRRDGEFRRYLQQPQRWRHYDQELYDALSRLLDPGAVRSVLNAEEWRLLPGAAYHDTILGDEAEGRVSYFSDAWERLRGTALMFLDPDNGFEVPSVKYGGRQAAKYLYWREATEAFARGHSLVVYQHFRRAKREPFIRQVLDELRRRLGGSKVEAYQTAHAAFLIAMRPEHRDALTKAAEVVVSRWPGQIAAAVAANNRGQVSRYNI
jgi:hypothetical protein